MTGETGFEPAQHSFGNCYSTVELLPYENFLKNNGPGVFSEADLFALAALVCYLPGGVCGERGGEQSPQKSKSIEHQKARQDQRAEPIVPRFVPVFGSIRPSG
jgi:hypothetical protein